MSDIKADSSIHPNVVLVVLDSVRARNMSLYGYKRETTPFLSRLSEDAITYTSAWSPTIWTLPSHVSMFSGYDVAEHGITSPEDAIDPGATIFTDLADRGYRTGLFSENTWLTEAEVGIKDSFETVRGKPSVVYPEALNPGEFAHRNEYGDYLGFLFEALSHDAPVKSLLNGVAAKVQYDLPERASNALFTDATAEYFVDEFLDWTTMDEGPWAACLNLMDAHRPYRPKSENDNWSDDDALDVQESLNEPVWSFLNGDEPLWKLEKLVGLYDGGIRQCDRAIERLFEGLDERDQLDETFVLIAGDHGEGFGESSFVRDGSPVVEHKHGIHPVQTHVPLVVRTPDASSEVIDTPVSLTRTYDALGAIATGGFSPDVFEPDSRVRISFTGDSAQIPEGRRYQDGETARSIVEVEDGNVVKLTEWAGSSATVQIRSAQALDLIEGRDVESRVDTAFSSLRDSSVRTDRDDDFSESVERRLEELGYR